MEYDLRGVKWRLDWTTGILDWITIIVHEQVTDGELKLTVLWPLLVDSETWSVGVEEVR